VNKICRPIYTVYTIAYALYNECENELTEVGYAYFEIFIRQKGLYCFIDRPINLIIESNEKVRK